MERDVDIGQTYERIFGIYRSQLALLLPAALVLFVPVAIVRALIEGVAGAILVSVVASLAGYWYQGMVVEAAKDMLDGRRDHSVGSLFSAAMPVILPLLGAGILAGVGIAIGFILLIVPGLFLVTIWAVIAPVIVVERKGALESFGRSREIVKGNGWSVFGVIAILVLAQIVLTLILSAVFGGSSAGQGIAQLIVSVLIAPLSALAAAVIYFELAGSPGADSSAKPDPATGPAGLT